VGSTSLQDVKEKKKTYSLYQDSNLGPPSLQLFAMPAPITNKILISINVPNHFISKTLCFENFYTISAPRKYTFTLYRLHKNSDLFTTVTWVLTLWRRNFLLNFSTHCI
jgi:hypothetical protein